MNKYRFSVWTATYNRKKLLKRVYNSLLSQTFKDFEWIIIDDGSTDNTEDVVKEFIEDGILKSIRYIKKENGGKHTAWREATKLFIGKYVVTIDSDDYLVPNALEIFDKYWNELENSSEYNDFWEVKARAIYEDGTLVGRPLSKPIIDAHANEISYKTNLFSDLHGCRKAVVLRNEAKVPDSFLYEEHCSNFQESIRWFRAGRTFKTRYVEEITECVTVSTNDRLSTSSNKHNQRSKTLTYNTLVGSFYQLNESREDMLKWRRQAYYKTIAVLLYTSFCLKINPLKLPYKKLSFQDKIVLYLGYLPIYILCLVRG